MTQLEVKISPPCTDAPRSFLDFSDTRFDALRAKAILIVDDVPDNANLLKEILVRGEFTNVFEIFSGQDTLDFLRQFDTENKKPIELIILDVNMPDMDGWEVARSIRRQKQWLNIPIVMITACNTYSQETINKCFQSGACSVLFKPISALELIPCIMSVLQNPSK